jgi:phosphopantetheine adenylyltransferase
MINWPHYGHISIYVSASGLFKYVFICILSFDHKEELLGSYRQRAVLVSTPVGYTDVSKPESLIRILLGF